MSQAVISTSQGRDTPIVERNIHEMLKDTPVMNDSNNAVHSGTAPPSPQRVSYIPHPTSLPLTTTTAPSTVPTTPMSPTQNGDPTVLKAQQSKIETIKNWSISTYKCTKQLMFEKLGKTSRTVDTELEAQIEQLRDTQRKYSNVLRLSRALASHFYHVVQTQHALGEAFSDLAQKSPELQEEFLYNAETQRNLTKNGETLLGALNFFVSSVNTLCNKTIEDTLLTIRQYEAARIEYDAYRTDLELLAQAPRTDVNTARLEEAQQSYELHKVNFEKLRSDVSIKLKFLDENRIKVMHKQLLLFHNAVSAYFSGNQTALEATLKQFNIKVKSPNSSFPSWLEQ
ncbi:Arfaptin-2 [Cryptotermes secundus]|uniref:Arfaptin-2 n=1 Tax=Cryptotermes secundus TaxID=105785 RepID=A0A2J7R1S2_9NEOP|nr:arfaptin-2 [Cryptotermes secundus]PNF34781.1 Arfaptin-2 [Cryptotermes secundus]